MTAIMSLTPSPMPPSGPTTGTAGEGNFPVHASAKRTGATRR